MKPGPSLYCVLLELPRPKILARTREVSWATSKGATEGQCHVGAKSQTISLVPWLVFLNNISSVQFRVRVWKSTAMSGYDTRHDGNGESYRSHSKEGERGGSSPYDAFEERDSHHKVRFFFFLFYLFSCVLVFM